MLRLAFAFVVLLQLGLSRRFALRILLRRLVLRPHSLALVLRIFSRLVVVLPLIGLPLAAVHALLLAGLEFEQLFCEEEVVPFSPSLRRQRLRAGVSSAPEEVRSLLLVVVGQLCGSALSVRRVVGTVRREQLVFGRDGLLVRPLASLRLLGGLPDRQHLLPQPEVLVGRENQQRERHADRYHPN